MSLTQDAVSTRVIQYVENASGIDARELPPLYDSIDPEALDALITTMSDGEIVFTYAGYQITVSSNEEIDLEEWDPSTPLTEKTRDDA